MPIMLISVLRGEIRRKYAGKMGSEFYNNIIGRR